MEPDIFFASRMSGLLELRQWVHAYGQGQVWVSEHSARHLGELIARDPDSVRVACLHQVKASRQLICVFNGEYGSVIATERAVSLGLEVSLLELELVTAVLAGVPVVVLLLGELPSDTRTQDLFAVLTSQETVRIEPTVYTNEGIKERLKAVLDEKIGRVPFPKRFMTRMSQVRLTRKANAMARPDINFLSNVTGFNRPADIDLIVELTQKMATEANQYDKLALLWMALRQYMPVDVSAPREYLLALAKALSGWVNAASWAGLHGHSYVGVLAALQSIKRISETLGGGVMSRNRDTVLASIDGGIASQYYSTHKLMDNDTDRRILLERSAAAVQAAIESGQSLDRVLPIKASVLVALGRRSEALATFEAVLELRSKNPDSSLAAIGEAEADLGWGHFLNWHFGRAYSLLEQGTNTLRNSGNVPFLVKQLRKFAYVAMTRNPKRVFDALDEAHTLAMAHGLADQVRQIESFPIVGSSLRRRRRK